MKRTYKQVHKVVLKDDEDDLKAVSDQDLYKMRKLQHDQFEQTWNMCQQYSDKLKAIDEEINSRLIKSNQAVLEVLTDKLEEMNLILVLKRKKVPIFNKKKNKNMHD